MVPRIGRNARRRFKGFTVCKNGHVYAYLYPKECEKAALRALAACPGMEAEEVLALVCYLGHDPRALGLDKPV